MRIRTQKFNKFYALVFLLVIIASCKTKKITADNTVNTRLSSKAVINTHYQNEINFNTLSGRMKIDYSDGATSQGITVSFRIKKGETIWLSAPLGLVKVLITPKRVSFYNKLQNEYFDGDFTYLSNLLGTELDYEKVENLLLGQAVYNLKEEKFNLSLGDNTYRLTPKKSSDLFKILYLIEPQNYKMALQQISQPRENRLLEIKYTSYATLGNRIIPSKINIRATEENSQTDIAIEYRNAEFNQSLRFPYRIPKGYKEIVLK